jgi:copper chaperone
MKNELQVSGMKCSSCELLVTEALEDLEGVIEVKASQLEGTVSVDYDPNMVSISAIEAVIEEQGFKVKS